MLRGSIVFAAFALAACKPNGLIVPYDCDHPCVTCSDPCGECKNGECVEPPALGFFGPVLLAIGPEGTLPECPEAASFTVYEGAGPGSMPDCPTCTCAPPVCELPAEVWGDVTTCPGAMTVPFGVSGSCAAPAMAPPGMLLSVTLGAFGPSACEPEAEDPVPLDGPVPERIHAKACGGVTVDPNPCTDMGMLCAAVDPGGLDFRTCIFKDGDAVQCPEPYTDPFVFYEMFEDTRACTTCACGPAEGSACAVDVTLHGDGTCISSLTTYPVDEDASLCIETGVEFQSVETTIAPGSDPGSCAPSGGTPTGGIEGAVAPATFCCQSL